MNQNKKLFIVLFIIAIFVSAVVVWYSPIVFKGYPSGGVSKEIILARNYYQSGVLADQNDLNVTLAPGLVSKQGHPLVLSEYLSSLFYAQIFKLIGVPSHHNLVLISIILYALVLVLFTILTLYLFNIKVAAVFSLIYIFSPLGWGLSSSLGAYEFCLIFWALFFIFYFVGIKKTKSPQYNKFNNLLFSFSGIFLAFSAFSAEVTLVFALAFFVFLALKRLKKQLVFIFIPFIILLIIFWAPSVISGENRYLGHLFGSKAPEKSAFSSYTHVFPDPYTYYFEKQEFLEKFKSQDLGLTENLETKKILTNFGFAGISLGERIKVGTYILSKHIFRFFSLQIFGGPFILLLWILGIIYLKNKYKFLHRLFVYWIGISIFIFSFVILVSRNHLMDFIWPIILGIALGLVYIFNIFKAHFQFKPKKQLILAGLVIILIVYHLLLVNHVVFGEKYDKDFVPKSMAYAKQIKKFDVEDSEVIAIPGSFPAQNATLNYLANKSFVVFRESTLEKLIKEEKVNQAFKEFGVKYILGYSDQLSRKITDQGQVINIASQSLEIDRGEISANKSFLMNLIR